MLLVDDALTWKPIPGWPAFEISERGDVRRVVKGDSNASRAGRILKQSGVRYRHVTLHHNRKHGTFSVHRLLALAFIGPAPSSRHQACHNDGDAWNNHWTNLRWALPAENNEDRRRHGTLPIGDSHSAAKVTVNQIRAIETAAQLGLPQDVIAAVAGISQTHVSRIVRGEGRR